MISQGALVLNEDGEYVEPDEPVPEGESDADGPYLFQISSSHMQSRESKAKNSISQT